ncbi:sigma-54-dependent transcriptional regulator [Chitinophaga tropicalis]|uniref:Response regulator n=1 Tax=Chitinophaga tropicalis TaxID=2683588 RepID=A0A7K1U4Y9_9BACT|nr:sigma-54 dependent transcriptional regulator [Chitinophaga tropicalis]MVT09427.1 response regulator [Chitinophaga tropicalis]
MQYKILIVEDELVVAGNLRMTLEKNGYYVSGVARSVFQAEQLLSANRPDMVMIDIYLKGNLTGIDLAITLNEQGIPFVYISANSSRDILEAAKATGPYGFIVKPFREKDVLIALDIAFYRRDAKQYRPKGFSISGTGQTWEEEKNTTIKSPAMIKVMELVNAVCKSDTSVLLLGESGTGKEFLADYIYSRSARKDGPFIKVNCGAIPAQLIEQELFGSEKGAFTDAFERKTGKFEQAQGGTLFLDEVAEMPVDAQAKLLRVLQEKELYRLGGKDPVCLNVRIIAATNRILEEEIAEGRFRLDLYYRLQVFPVTIPPLRERKEDIPVLAEDFVRYYADTMGKKVSLSEHAVQLLTGYSWPGNIRELQNIIERHVVLAGGALIDEILLPRTELEIAPLPVAQKPWKTLEDLEKDHIVEVLAWCNYRISGPDGAAAILGVSPAVLTAKIKKMGIVKQHTGT